MCNDESSAFAFSMMVSMELCGRETTYSDGKGKRCFGSAELGIPRATLWKELDDPRYGILGEDK